MKFLRNSGIFENLFRGLQLLSVITAGCLLSSCVDKEKEAALAKEVQEKKDHFEGLKRTLVEKNEELNRTDNEISELKDATRNLQRTQKQELEVTKEFNDLKKYSEEVKASIDLLDGSLAVWRKATRDSMRGLQVGSVDLGGGKILSEATVVEVTDDSVRFSHQGSQTQAKLADLPIPLRERLVDESLVIQNIRIDQSQK